MVLQCSLNPHRGQELGHGWVKVNAWMYTQDNPEPLGRPGVLTWCPRRASGSEFFPMVTARVSPGLNSHHACPQIEL